MSTLGPSDFLKAGTIPKAAHKNTNHPYFGKTRLQIIKLKIKDGKPFALGKDGKGGNKPAGPHLIQKSDLQETLQRRAGIIK